MPTELLGRPLTIWKKGVHRGTSIPGHLLTFIENDGKASIIIEEPSGLITMFPLDSCIIEFSSTQVKPSPYYSPAQLRLAKQRSKLRSHPNYGFQQAPIEDLKDRRESNPP